MAEVHLIRVELEDLIFGEVFLDVDCQQRFVRFAPPTFLGREEDLLRQLLRQRRCAFFFSSGDRVFQQRANDRLRIDSAVVIEVRILGRDDRADQMRRHVAFRDDNPFLNRVLGEADAVAIVDVCDDRGRVVLERFHDRHPDRVREYESRRNAEPEKEKNDEEAGAAARRRRPGNDLSHGDSLTKSIGREAPSPVSAPETRTEETDRRGRLSSIGNGDHFKS